MDEGRANNFKDIHGDYIKSFNKRHPEIEIRFVETIMDLGGQSKFLQILSGELDVDIIQMGNSEIHNYTKMGIVLDMSVFGNIVQRLEDPTLLEGVYDNCITPENMLFGVPWNATYYGYAVNTALFEKHMLSIPDKNWTYNDYYILAREVIRINSESSEEIYMHAQYKDDRYRLSRGLPSDPMVSGYASSNLYAPRYNTPEMLDYVRKSKELYIAFPFSVAKSPSGEKQPLAKNALFTIIIMGPYDDGVFENPILPPPSDMYGDNVSPFTDYLSVYSKANNPSDAALFIAEFLNEDWHRENVNTIQLYKDANAYTRFNFLKKIEPLVIEMTKFTVHFEMRADIMQLYWELEDKYFTGVLTAEEFVDEMQRGVEKRILG